MDLTKRQQEIFDFIRKYSDLNGYPPTVRDIGKAVGLASSSTVHAHLANLEKLGVLRRDPTKPRALELLDRAPGNRNWYALRVVYLPQLLILWVACLPLTAGMTARAPAGAVIVTGVVVWMTGFAFEVVGDWQLARFRADPASKGQLMDRGLWRYTRHPNYFGDACMWWGLFLISYGSPLQLLTLASPLLMTFILTRGTGQRLTDRRMAGSRPGFAAYAARTSGFIPLPPRRPRRPRRPLGNR